MTWKIEVTKTGYECFEKIKNNDPQGFAKLSIKIDKLADDPHKAGIKLSEPLAQYWRLKQGKYRVVYKIENDIVTVFIVYAGDRKDVYKRLKRFLRK